MKDQYGRQRIDRVLRERGSLVTIRPAESRQTERVTGKMMWCIEQKIGLTKESQ